MSEEHLLLRVPNEIQQRLDNILKKDLNEEVYYEKETGRNYIFVIGKDRYFAALKDLPTRVDTHKTVDQTGYYKVADVGQILEVSNIKDVPGVSRPTFDEISNDPADTKTKKRKRQANDYTLNSGILPSMKNVKKGLSKEEEKVDPQHLKKIDTLFVELEAEVTKRERSAEEAQKPFVLEELIDEEPYMQYWDEKTEIEQGKDNFLSSSKKAYDLAYERYLAKNPQKTPENLSKKKVIKQITTQETNNFDEDEEFNGLLDDIDLS